MTCLDKASYGAAAGIAFVQAVGPTTTESAFIIIILVLLPLFAIEFMRQL